MSPLRVALSFFLACRCSGSPNGFLTKTSKALGSVHVNMSEASGGAMPWRAWATAFPGKTLADFRQLCDGLDPQLRQQCYRDEFTKADPFYVANGADELGVTREDYKLALALAQEWYPGPDANRMIADAPIIIELSMHGVIPADDEPMPVVPLASSPLSPSLLPATIAGWANQARGGSYKHAIDAEVTAPFVRMNSSLLPDAFVELPGPADTVCPDGVGNGSCAGSLGPFQMRCAKAATVTFQAEMIAPDGNSDSFFIEMSSNSFSKQAWHTGSRADNDWFWSRRSPAFIVGPGGQSVTLKGREDGLAIKTLKILDGSDSCTFTTGFQVGPVGDDSKCTSPDGRGGEDCYTCPGEARLCSGGFTGVWQRYEDYGSCNGRLSKYTCIKLPEGDDTRCLSPAPDGRRDCYTCPEEDRDCADDFIPVFQHLVDYDSCKLSKYTCIDNSAPICVWEFVQFGWKVFTLVLEVLGLPAEPNQQAIDVLVSTFTENPSWMQEIYDLLVYDFPKEADKIWAIVEHLYNRGITRGFWSALYNNSGWKWFFTIVRILATMLSWVVSKGVAFAAKLVGLAFKVTDTISKGMELVEKCGR